MTLPRAFRPLLAAPALAALAACATLRTQPPAADPALLSGGPARLSTRDCGTDRAPGALPDADELVDAEGLATDVARLAAGRSLPAGYVLLSMGYAPDGANVRRAVIEHSLPPRLADSLQKLVFARRRGAAPQPREWGVRMRVDVDAAGTLALRVGRRELCAPRPLGRGMFTLAGTSRTPLPDPYAEDSPAAYTVWVRVRLDELGRVMDASLERGMVRGVSEAMLLGYVRSMSFHPAVEDGRPVPGETRVPVRLPG
jgi:hypothetical protein